VVGLTLQELQRIPAIIGVAATASKSMPVYGALRGKHVRSLITDEAAAQGVLQIFEGEFQGKKAARVQEFAA
jgi:DNA-binding transcriptional regulator LsrR (DeoR family)